MASSRAASDLPRIRLSSVHSRTNSQVSDKYVTPAYHKLDPLLSNLSPEATIQALSSTDTLPIHEKGAHDILTKSISEVSSAERALGIRAAIAAQNLTIWLEEVQSWQWPKGRDAELGKGFEPPPCVSGDDDTKNASPPDVEGEYYGSIPAELVGTYEARIEEIRDGIDDLGVDDLKEHVLDAHIPARSRPSSSTSTTSVPPPLSYVQLSDFTAVVTATILRALPLLSRLNRLLSVWDIRLLVLRQIPGLLRGLKSARFALDACATSLNNPLPPDENDDLYSRSTFRARHAKLEAAVVHVGRRMDRILDTLEGREDSLPEKWIDELEGLEADFSTWVVEAERRALENEWKRQRSASLQNVHDVAASPDFVQNGTSESDFGRSTGPAVMETIAEEESSEPADTPYDGISPRPRRPQDEAASFGVMHSESIHDSPVNVVMERAVPETPVPDAESIMVSQSEQGVTTDGASLEQEARLDSNESAGPFAPESPELVPGHSLDHVINTSGEDRVEAPHCEESSLSAARNTELQTATLSAGTAEQEGAYSDTAEAHGPETSREAATTDTAPTTVADDGLCAVKTAPHPVVATAFVSDQNAANSLRSIRLEGSVNSTSVPELTGSVIDGPSHVLCSTDAKDSTNNKLDPQTLQLDSTGPHAGDVARPVAADADSEHTKLQDSLVTDVSEQSAATRDLARTDERIVDDVEPSAASLPERASSEGPSTGLLPDVANMCDALAFPEHGSDSAFPEPNVKDEGNGETARPKKKLDSPIKLSKLRPRHLNLHEDNGLGHRRHVSDVSALSSMSDHPSFGSSSDLLEPKTASSNGTQFLLTTPPFLKTDFSSTELVCRKGGSSPRESQFLRLHGRSPRNVVKHNRTVSLPLQRFMSGTEEVVSDNPLVSNAQPQITDEGSSVGSTKKSASNSNTASSTELSGQHTSDEVPCYHEESAKVRSPRVPPQRHRAQQPTETSVSATSTHIEHAHPNTVSSKSHPRLPVGKKRLTAHPSLEFLGRWKSQTQHSDVPVVAEENGELELRPSAPVRTARKFPDALDRKINTILSTLSADVQLVSSEEPDSDESSMGSAFVPHRRERFQSLSPVGSPSRASTPNSTLSTPHAYRRRHSHAPVFEGSSVKVYHLHRSGKSVPQKLFIRSVGENGERVMVRVGGGWADLGEYLREFAIHHGRRRVSETMPRVDVQDLSPGDRRTPRSSLGRTTPSRPQSVLDYQSSSLTVRKTRPARNVASVFDTKDSEDADSAYSPPVFLSQSRRRLSVCSTRSVSAGSHMGDTPTGSSVPLGLAGPLPRSRHVSMSPESEAWVEDVLGQAKVNTARPSRNGVLYVRDGDGDGQREAGREPGVPRPLLKARSVSDMGTASLSKRVVLRGLYNRKD